MGTLASIRAFLESRSLTVCLGSLVLVLTALGSELPFERQPAPRDAWFAAATAHAALLSVVVWVLAWVNLVGACRRGYSPARCQVCCVVLFLEGAPLALLAYAFLDRVATF